MVDGAKQVDIPAADRVKRAPGRILEKQLPQPPAPRHPQREPCEPCVESRRKHRKAQRELVLERSPPLAAQRHPRQRLLFGRGHAGEAYAGGSRITSACRTQCPGDRHVPFAERAASRHRCWPSPCQKPCLEVAPNARCVAPGSARRGRCGSLSLLRTSKLVHGPDDTSAYPG